MLGGRASVEPEKELPWEQAKEHMSLIPSVLLVEDHLLTLAGLRLSLEHLHCCSISGEASDGDAAVQEAQRLRPDVILMDVGLPGIDGIEATWRIKQLLPRTRVIMFTSHTSPEDITAALGAGADGYCSKSVSVEQIAAAISAVMRGEVWLDPDIATAIVDIRALAGAKTDSVSLEVEILSMIKEGIENREIAIRLNISPEKVTRIMQKLIHQFMEKSESNKLSRQTEKKLSHDWLTAFVDGLDNEKTFADKYLIEKLIGTGGIGAVFKAKHMYMDRNVALKILHPEFVSNRLAMRNFQGEAKAIASLQHKNIVGVYDFGLSPDLKPFLVMEYVDGSDLGEILAKESPMPVSRVLTIALQVCAGLAEAHAHGIIHCDLKPSNILIQGVDFEGDVKVVDFGLAQIKPPDNADDDNEITAKIFISGTPLYMSPEQCNGQPLTGLSDIYALGCILYEALAGVNIFEDSTPMGTFVKQCDFNPPPMSVTYPSGLFSKQLEDLVSNMLAKDPAKRPQSMSEVISALTAIKSNESERPFLFSRFDEKTV
jgi:serine/threonine protein kinase/CheY-like chemotaxis protein